MRDQLIKRPFARGSALLTAPWHDRYGADRILGRAFDDSIRVAEIDERVVGLVIKPYDLQLLEQQGTAFFENILALLEVFLDRDRSHLPAGNGSVGGILGKTYLAFDAASHGSAHMTHDALHLRVIKGIDTDLVIGQTEDAEGR